MEYSSVHDAFDKLRQMTSAQTIAQLRAAGVEGGSGLGVAFREGIGIGLAPAGHDPIGITTTDPVSVICDIEDEIKPRWVWWDRHTVDPIAAQHLAIARCWDVLIVHRLLNGGWRTSIAEVWAQMRALSTESIPAMGQLGLLDQHGDEGTDPDNPIRPDQHLRPEWVSGAWGDSPERLAKWAQLALRTAAEQRQALSERPNPERALSTAHSESTAEFMCAELENEGLPIDLEEAVRIISEAVGPRPRDIAHEDTLRIERDREVLKHLDQGPPVDLRNPGDVKAMLRRVAVDVPDTRAWRLEQHRDSHPLVGALLTWRKAERISTTYGYRWLDEHVSDGRLRGEWTSADGAAGRMTASSGLHNLPAEMRPAVEAEPGHIFIRADLGQIEPRVLAAVSGDRALISATADDDLYQPVAKRLNVEREVAKVAVLGAMYGATTGESAHALRGLEREFPAAMKMLSDAAELGRDAHDVMTIGGRRIRMWQDESIAGDIDRARRVAAARGRFARNALIQGAAAEFFKVWALTIRARGSALDAKLVLCLHDEVLVHVPEHNTEAAIAVVSDGLAEAAYRWSPEPEVRFVADISAIKKWSEAKA